MSVYHIYLGVGLQRITKTNVLHVLLIVSSLRLQVKRMNEVTHICDDGWRKLPACSLVSHVNHTRTIITAPFKIQIRPIIKSKTFRKNGLNIGLRKLHLSQIVRSVKVARHRCLHHPHHHYHRLFIQTSSRNWNKIIWPGVLHKT